MANPSKTKGTAAETAVVNYLAANGFPHAERRACNGVNDRGDVTGIPGAVIEVKACKTLDLAGWMKELDTECENALAEVGALWVKRRGTTDPGDWYVVMDGEMFTDLLRTWAA